MKKIFITAIALMLGSLYASSQNSIVNEKDSDTSDIVGSQAQINDKERISLSLINTRKSQENIVEDFILTESEYINDPKTPHLLLSDSDGKIGFGIGGFVRMRASYHFLGMPTDRLGFSPYSIPFPSDPSKRNGLDMDPSNSALFFKLVGRSSALGLYQVYVSGDFTGKDYSFVLKDAYFSARGFTVGHTWSTFSDMASIPPTIDYLGPNGAAKLRTSQVRYVYTTPDNLSLGIAAELPEVSASYTNLITSESSQVIPDIPIYMQYTWGKRKETSHVRVAGIMRNMNYRNMLCNKTETATGIGVQFSSNIRITPIVELYGQITYGSGIADYINDLSGNGLSLVKNPNKPGKMQPLEALGWLGQVRINVADPVFVTFGYSEAKVFPKSGVMLGDAYRYGEYLVGNIFYNVTNDFQLGMEYLWGSRKNMNGEKKDANCIQTQLVYHF